jgi:hypothetical protein
MDKNSNAKPTSKVIKNKPLKPKKTIKKKGLSWRWPIKIFFITLVLSLIFSISSELLLTGTGIAISISIIVFLLFVSVIFDMLGVAVAAASLQPFVAMSSKRVRGSKEAIFLVKNAEKIASISADVIGDICGILSGAVGAGVALQIYAMSNDFKSVIIASIVSSIIAALTVFGKSIGKKFAINHPEKIVFSASKIISFFNFTSHKR